MKSDDNPYLPRVDTMRLLNLLDVGHTSPAAVTTPSRRAAGDFRFPDADRDGVPDLFDCDPIDPTADGWIGDAYRRAQSFFKVDYAAAARRRASVGRAVSRGTRAAATVVRRAPPSPTRYIAKRVSAAVSRRVAPTVKRIVSRPSSADIKRVTAATFPKTTAMITGAVELKKAAGAVRPPSRAELVQTGITAFPTVATGVAVWRGVVAAKPVVAQALPPIDFGTAARRRADVREAGWGAPIRALAGIAETGEPFRGRMESRIAAVTARQQAKFPEGAISSGSRRFAEATARVAKVARGFEQPVEQRMLAAEERLGLHSERIPAPIRTLGWAGKELGYGVAFAAPAGAVELVGMVPVAAEAVWDRPEIIPAAVGVGMVTMGKGIYHGATTSPTRLFGELVAFGAYVKGLGAIPKASPYYLGQAKGVKPHTGRPSLWGRVVKGEKPHPTPEAKMAELYDPKLYEAPQKFFHGTSVQFIKSARAAGDLIVHPGEAAARGARGVEASLFLSEPGRPYIRFATPETIVRVGKGASAVEVRASILEQLMTGKLTRQKITEMGLKDVKASSKLRSLIKKRGSLQRELAELEKSKLSEISPKRMKTEAELYDAIRKTEKAAVKEYGKATGDRVSVHDEPGAFLMVETTPRKPSAALVKKATRRESLRTLEKEGKITPKQTKELRRLERELRGEAAREYFGTPRGEVVPSPKPTWGYEWKGITESEFVMRAGTKLYPTTTGRSQMYGRFGVMRGTHFTQDPYTGMWMEVQKVTPTKPTPTAKSSMILDVPELFHPFRKATKYLSERKLTTKEKSEIMRIDQEIKKATAKSDYRRVEELYGRRRVLQYGKSGMDVYQRPTLPETRPTDQAYRPLERVTRPVDRVERGIRPTDRVIRETRPTDRVFRPAERVTRPVDRAERGIRPIDRVIRETRPTDREFREPDREFRVDRVTRPTDRTIREGRVIDRGITTTTDKKLTTTTTHLTKEDKRRYKVRGEREEYEWHIGNPLITLEEFFASPLQPKKPVKSKNMIPMIPVGVV